MLTHRTVMIGIGFVATLSLSTPAWATIDNFKSFKQAYPGKDPKAYSCKVCHLGAIGKKGDLNAYGLALQKLKMPADAKKLTEQDYRTAEKDDADGDGVSNLDEWTAGTDFADPKLFPKDLKPKEAAPPVPERQPDEKTTKPAGANKPSSRLTSNEAGQVQAYLQQWSMPQAWADQPDSKPSTEQATPQDQVPAKAEYVGMDTCATCHAKQFEEFKHSTHARIAIPGDQAHAQGCEMCHGPGSLHVEAGGGRGVGGIINPRKDPSTCFACHLDKKAEFRLPYRHPVLEGKMSCLDCHSAHGEEVRPWSATSMKDINEACFKCHKDQRGPFVNEHEALREGCTTCHKVHGSIHEKMLLARDANLCLRCHTQTNFPTIGGSGHGSRLHQGTCFSAGCHTAPHGSNFDEHLRY